MQATLIYNRNAGRSRALDVEDALDTLRDAGYEPVYRPTRSEQDLDSALARAEGLIVAAGGDGTLRAVITRLVNSEKPLAVIPMGTANNVGSTLGLTGEPLALIRQLNEVRVSHYDLGRIQGPWGTNYFLEGAGFGFFADILHTYRPDKGKSILRGIEALRSTISEDYAITGRLWVDGKQYSDNYLVVELLNTKAVGPRLQFAPDADPTDGYLDVVRVRKSGDDGFLAYTARMMRGELTDLSSVEVSRARGIRFLWTGFSIHIDAELWPPEAEKDRGMRDERALQPFHVRVPEEQMIDVDVLPGAIELWLPQQEDDKEGRSGEAP
jgi:diacylglycerol kinase (ATP)